MVRPLLRNAICWKASGDGPELVASGLEDVRVGQKRDRRAGLRGLLTLLDAARHGAGHRFGTTRVAVAVNVGLDPGGQRVDHRRRQPVQTALTPGRRPLGLAAGVRDRHDDVDGGHTGCVHLDRDAATVVADLDTAVLSSRTSTRVANPGQPGLVDRVVGRLPDQMVQAARSPVEPMYMPGRLRTASQGLSRTRSGSTRRLVRVFFGAARSNRSLGINRPAKRAAGTSS